MIFTDNSPQPMNATMLEDVPVAEVEVAQLFRVVYERGARWKVDVYATSPLNAAQAVTYAFSSETSVRIIGVMPMETNR